MEIFSTNQSDPTILAIERVAGTMGNVAGQAAVDIHESASPLAGATVDVPPDIQELLSHGLTDARMSGGNQTSLYRISGHPDLLARCNEHVPKGDLRLAYDDARRMGLPVLPAQFVKRKSVTYVITKIVDGVVADEALASDPSAELVEAWSQAWAAFGRTIADAHETDAYWPTDVVATKQFMWGTLAGDTESRLWMVDLPTNSYALDEPNVYGMTLLDAIQGLLGAEKALGREMPLAREQYARAVAQCPDSKIYGNGIRNLAAHWLANGKDTDNLAPDEPRLAALFRTN